MCDVCFLPLVAVLISLQHAVQTRLTFTHVQGAIRVFLRDGLIYFFAISFVHGTNAILMWQSDIALGGLLSTFSMMLPNLLVRCDSCGQTLTDRPHFQGLSSVRHSVFNLISRTPVLICFRVINLRKVATEDSEIKFTGSNHGEAFVLSDVSPSVMDTTTPATALQV
jgi:hypothetical protein